MPPPKAPPRPAPPSQNNEAAKDAVSRPSLARGPSAFVPPRIVINAVEGFGKTSAAAYAESPAVLMAEGETGYLTLLGSGRVPDVPRAVLSSWPEVLAMVDDLIADPVGVKTLALDALGGFERLCHQHVCARDFGGNWGEKGFGSYNKGYDVSVPEWLQLLNKLDRLRLTHGVTVLMLSHTLVRPFKNPMGDDFDRYVANIHAKTWGETHKWADAVLFGNFWTVTKKDGNRAKGVGGTDRVIQTERRDAFDAKNRYGMPEMIQLPDDPAQSWDTIWSAIKGAN